ncbi:hypothetical protein NPIL_581901, partial [Nephila pilipes]
IDVERRCPGYFATAAEVVDLQRQDAKL